MKKPSRLNFAKIRGEYEKRGVKGVRLTQSSLFLTQAIDPTKANYSFDVLESQNTNLQPDEIRLNINDEFIITHQGLYLYGRTTVGDPVTAQSPILLTTAPIELNSATMELDNLYAGTLKLAVNNIVYTEKWDVRKHQVKSRTQFASFIAGVPVATIPSLHIEDDGMISLEPMLTLSGAKKNDLNLNFVKAFAPKTFAFKGQDGVTQNIVIDRIAWRFYGLNAQNAAKFQ